MVPPDVCTVVSMGVGTKCNCSASDFGTGPPSGVVFEILSLASVWPDEPWSCPDPLASSLALCKLPSCVSIGCGLGDAGVVISVVESVVVVGGVGPTCIYELCFPCDGSVAPVVSKEIVRTCQSYTWDTLSHLCPTRKSKEFLPN